MAAQLALNPTTQRDVEVAWATYRALCIAEHDDVRLHKNAAHQVALSTAQTRFMNLFDDWIRS
jgi:hypothetical protein